MEGIAIASTQSKSESNWKFLGDFEAAITKTDSFWENLEEKVFEIWNEVDADVVRSLYENYTNGLPEVETAKGVITRY